MKVFYQAKGYRIAHKPESTKRTPWHLIGLGRIQCFKTKRQAEAAIPMIEDKK